MTGAPFELAPLEAVLSASGFSLLAVSRADSALNAVRAGGVALVLLDGAQAGSSSFELCRRLISASPAPDLPIVMLTPGDEPDEQKRALSAGARAWLRLPFSTGAVLEQVLALLPAPDAPSELSAGIEQLRQLRLTDAASHRHAEALREGQNQLLEMVARGAPLRTTLDKLMLLIEAQSPGVLCSTLLLDLDGRTIRTGAGPSLPDAYLDAIDGLSIGAVAGSCGTAMYRKEAVVVADIMNDPLWAPYAGIAAQYGLRACWSVPILMDADTVLGSFAMYYREVRSPTTGDLRLIGVATHLAGIAIARTRHEDELKRHRRHLEELVDERTSELRRAKERVEMANDELATALENLSMTQDELVRRDKLAALGALVAGVAHELNTPIGNCLMAAGSMAERTRALRAAIAGGARRSELDAYLDEAVQADEIVVRNLTRAASLLHSFKEIAVDTDRSQRRRFMLDALVAELIPPLHAQVKHVRVSVVQDIAPELELDSYPAPLNQVLQALFDNSVVHGFEGRDSGRIRISARMTDKGEIALSFADDGKGISTEDQMHVYDPFFTTRRGTGGSGLGLHVAHNIVAGVLGGRIKLASAPGQGAVFTLLLPPVAPL